MVFWLALSGHYTPLLLTLGAVSAILVIWVTVRMEIVDEESLPLRLLPRLPRYLLWLSGQVLRSGFAVVRLVWSPRRGPTSVVAKVPAGGLADLPKVVYANSITFTPGTLSLALGDEDIDVHALQRDDIGKLRAGAMLDRVRGLEPR
jgi:multicomponent Na+:H+ antiporter subunit E